MSKNSTASVATHSTALDGGRIDNETFSADLAVVTVTGINTHPSEGKGKMVNAIRILSKLIDKLPQQTLSPETTDGRDGFLHPYQIEGGVPEASLRIILRDFETANLEKHANLIKKIANELMAEEPRCQINVAIKKQYRNMRDGLGKEPTRNGICNRRHQSCGHHSQPQHHPGAETDGSLLTEAGLPTPNLSSGQHNPHSPLEWTCTEEMQTAANILVQLAILWGKI